MPLAAKLAVAISDAPIRALDDHSRSIWKALSAGLLSDDEAQALAEAIHARRHSLRNGSRGAPGASGGPPKPKARSWSYFPPKRPQRSPDRQRSLHRRRLLAASSPLPPALAANFTTGELAVLRVVTDAVREKGTCCLSLPEIAARAGVGLTKARMAVREAEKHGLLTIEERRVPYRPNLPNVVRIINREWLTWIAKTAPRQSKGGAFTFVDTTESKGSKLTESEPRAKVQKGFRLAVDRNRWRETRF